MAGLVYTETRKLEKPGTQVRPDTDLTLKGQEHPWVSRGGLKLEHGLNHFGMDVAGAIALDVGASTGGFTDVLLSRGWPRYMPSMSDMVNSPGGCAKMIA